MLDVYRYIIRLHWKIITAVISLMAIYVAWANRYLYRNLRQIWEVEKQQVSMFSQTQVVVIMFMMVRSSVYYKAGKGKSDGAIARYAICAEKVP